MSNELRQAAERLRVSHHQEKGCPWESSVYESLHPRATIYLGDCWRVVNAYLAEHPADDDEPISFEAVKKQYETRISISLGHSIWIVAGGCVIRMAVDGTPEGIAEFGEDYGF